MAPEHPSMRTLIGATDETILQVAEQVYWEEWTLAPNSRTTVREGYRQELNKCMARAGLQGAPGSAGPPNK